MPSSAVTVSMKSRALQVHPVEDGLRGVDEEPADLRAGDEEHAVLQPAPAAVDEIARRAEMVGEQDRVNAGLLRVGQHLGQGAAGVVRILGVGVQDAAIVVEAGAGRDVDPLRLELLDVRMNGRQPVQREPFEVGVLARGRFGGHADGCEERARQYGNKPAGKQSHTWLLLVVIICRASWHRPTFASSAATHLARIAATVRESPRSIPTNQGTACANSHSKRLQTRFRRHAVANE